MDDINNQKEFEFHELNVTPSFEDLIYQRISSNMNKNPSKFDPYQFLLNKNKVVNDDKLESIKWPEKDLKILEDFCKENGIQGFNCGNMSPLSALSMLKKKIGFVDTPLEERVPEGYQKIHRYNPNHSYTQMLREKILLKG